jgi:2-keto-4-pentenoate hydratase
MPMSPQQIEQAAEQIAHARLRREPMPPPAPALRPPDADTAYAVQHALHRRLADAGLGSLGGWKIGCTTRVMQRYLCIDHPCAGGVLARTVHRREARLSIGAYCRVGVECELAVTLESDLPGPPSYARDDVIPAIGNVMAAIELVDDRWVDYTNVDTPSLIADDFFGAGCVLGEALRYQPHMDLAGVSGSMRVNGQRIGEGIGADILGHPLEALAWLANARIRAGDPLARGQIVLLGSIVKTCWLSPGDRVEIELVGLGGARAQVD